MAVIGHTGFHGNWVSIYQKKVWALFSGYSLSVDEGTTYSSVSNSLFHAEILIELRGGDQFKGFCKSFLSEFTFHWAAQDPVLESLPELETPRRKNVIGTENIFENIESLGRGTSAKIVTINRLHGNLGTGTPFVETDSLNKLESDSMSKTVPGLPISNDRRSYSFSDNEIRLDTTLLGNVIGGEYWLSDDITPVAIKASLSGTELEIRHPNAVRRSESGWTARTS